MLIDIAQLDAKGLELQLDELKHRFWKHLSQVYERLMENFDPKIIRFRKKYKVIFHRDSGLDELLD